MFCRNCGKEIGDAKFCSHCGCATKPDGGGTVGKTVTELLDQVAEQVMAVGHNKVMGIVMWLATVVVVWLRIANNDIITEYYALAADDMFVLSETGRTWILLVMGVELLLSGWLAYDAKKQDIEIPKGMWIMAICLVLVQLGAMLLKFHAA